MHGAVGETARALAGDLLPWAGKLDGGAWLLRWPDAEGHARLTSLGAGPALAALPGIDAAAWNWVSVRSGVPIVEAATVEGETEGLHDLHNQRTLPPRRSCRCP